MATVSLSIDPTLAALEAALVTGYALSSRSYLGASAIGHPCSRSLWYSFRWVLSGEYSPASIAAIQDGIRGEAVMIERLRAVQGITLWTESPDAPGKQIGFEDLAGHFRGNLDGIITGLLHAPEEPHVWECKVCNEEKFQRFIKLKTTDEGKALAEWDETYFAQAQVYMHYVEVPRHYLTVCTPGVRRVASCVTDYDRSKAEKYVDKAKQIITANRPPEKLSTNPAWWQCKFCSAASLCHSTAWPQVSCRTCAHSTATLDPAAPWRCDLLHRKPLPLEDQQAACPKHAYHPDLLINHASVVTADISTGAITYKLTNGKTVINGFTGVASLDWQLPFEQSVMAELSLHSGLSPEKLKRGNLSEKEWGAIPLALTIMGVTEEKHPRKFQVLKAILEETERSYCELAK